MQFYNCVLTDMYEIIMFLGKSLWNTYYRLRVLFLRYIFYMQVKIYLNKGIKISNKNNKNNKLNLNNNNDVMSIINIDQIMSIMAKNLSIRIWYY